MTRQLDPNDTSVHLYARLPAALYDAVRDRARETEGTVSGVTRLALREYLQRLQHERARDAA